MSTIVAGDFEWDSEKAQLNHAKHGVAFEEAIYVLTSDDVVEMPDLEDSSRVITIGFSAVARILYVVSTETGFRTRIISARRATAEERRNFADRKR